MAEPWPVIPPLHGGTSWAVDGDGESWTYFDTEAAARRYAALPVLIAAIRHAMGGGGRPCLYCGNTDDKHWRRCDGLAALKSAGEGT